MPYPVEIDDGKDVRDYLNDGHTFAELPTLAEAAPIVDAPANKEEAASCFVTRRDLMTLENYIRLGGMIREATVSGDWRLVDKLIGSQIRLARELSLTPSPRASLPPSPAAEDMADDLERFKRNDTELEPCRGEHLRDTD